MSKDNKLSSDNLAGHQSKIIKTDCALCIEKKKDNFRISIYFDGTLNNKYNTSAYKDGIKKDTQSSSYKNEYTNIARLEMNFTKHFTENDTNHSFSIYTEGVGTTNYGDDSDRSSATGMFSYGIDSKSKNTIEAIIYGITGRMVHSSIGSINIDLFGFSRGAATARYFIYLILKKKGKTLSDQLTKKGFSPESVTVKFVGLYDTVASYGIKHSNDTADLELGAVEYAEKVVQLAASEEFRANFRLTNIASAKSNGVEIFLPGAHADVGGGYVNNDAEIDHQVFYASPASDDAINRDVAWLTERGWYEGPSENSNGELKIGKIKDYYTPSPYGGTYIPSQCWINATRSGISHEYSYLTLRIMSEYARESGALHDEEEIKSNYPLPDEIVILKNLITARIKNGQAISASTWIDDTSILMKYIRHKYLHFSARYGGALHVNAPEWSEEGRYSGKRKRIIQDG